MSKKMLKRSLALGALMAFVITGSAMAAENIINSRVFLNGVESEFSSGKYSIAPNENAKTVYGIAAFYGAKGVAEGAIELSARTDISGGDAFGIYTYDGGYIQIKDNVKITAISGDNIAYGVISATDKNAVGKYNYIELGDSNKTVDIRAEGKGKTYGVIALNDPDPKETYKDTIVLNGSNVTITAISSNGEAIGVYAGSDTDDISTSVDLRNTVKINANETNINVVSAAGEKATGISSLSNGIVDISGGNLFVSSKDSNNEQGAAIVARGNSSVKINQGKDAAQNIVQLDGDIVFEAARDEVMNADLRINLNHAESYLNGQIYTYTYDVVEENGKNVTKNIEVSNNADNRVNGMNLTLSNGAKWNVTGDSFVNDLSGQGGKLVNAAEENVTVTLNKPGNVSAMVGTGVDVGEGVTLDISSDERDGNGIVKDVNITGKGNLNITSDKAWFGLGYGKNSIDVDQLKIELKDGDAWGTVYSDNLSTGDHIVKANDAQLLSGNDSVHNQGPHNIVIDVENQLDVVGEDGYAVMNASTEESKIDLTAKIINLTSNDRAAVKVGHLVGDEGYNGTVNIGDVNTEKITIKGAAQNPANGNERKGSAVYAQAGTINLSASNTITIEDTAKKGGNAIGAYGGVVNVKDAANVVIDGKVYATGEGSQVNITTTGDVDVNDAGIDMSSTEEDALAIATNKGAITITGNKENIITLTGGGGEWDNGRSQAIAASYGGTSTVKDFKEVVFAGEHAHSGFYAFAGGTTIVENIGIIKQTKDSSIGQAFNAFGGNLTVKADVIDIDNTGNGIFAQTAGANSGILTVEATTIDIKARANAIGGSKMSSNSTGTVDVNVKADYITLEVANTNAAINTFNATDAKPAVPVYNDSKITVMANEKLSVTGSNAVNARYGIDSTKRALVDLTAREMEIINNGANNALRAGDYGQINVNASDSLIIDGMVKAERNSEININANTAFDAEVTSFNATDDTSKINLTGGDMSGTLNIVEGTKVHLTGATFTAEKLDDAVDGGGVLVLDGSGVLKTVASEVFENSDTTATKDFNNEVIVNNEVVYKAGAISLAEDYSYEYLSDALNVMKAHEYEAEKTSATKIIMTGNLKTSVEDIGGEDNTITADQASGLGNGVELDKVTVEAEENLLIGGSASEANPVTADGVTAKDSVANGFSANELDLGDADGAIVTGGQELTLGGSDGSDNLVSSDTGSARIVIGAEVAGVSDSTAVVNIGNTSATEDTEYKLNGSVKVNEGSELNTKGQTEITEGVELDGGNINVESGQLNANITASGESTITGSVTGTLTGVDADTNINIGTADKTASVSLTDVNLNGAILSFDPNWDQPAGQSGMTLGANGINGSVQIARNNYVALGTADRNAAKAMFEKTGLTFGPNVNDNGNITAALYIAGNQTLHQTQGSIYVDGSKEQTAFVPNPVAGTFSVAANSITMVDANTTTASLSGVVTANIDDAAKLYIDEAADGQTYKVLAGVDDGWQDANILTNNQLIKFTGDVQQDGAFNVTAGLQDVSEVYGNDVIIADVVDEAVSSDTAATEFFNATVNEKVNASKEAQVSAMNSAGSINELAGVSHATYAVSNILTDAVADHVSLANSKEHDKDIWAHYVHTKENIEGLKGAGVYDAQYNGIVVGTDLYKEGKATVGAALTYVDGNINGSTLAARTENDAKYYGASIYGSIENKDTAVIADVSYLHGEHDITQRNSGATITGEPESDAFSVGVRVEQSTKAGIGKLVPYAGLRYMHLGTGNYTNSIGLAYDADDAELFLLPVGLKYSSEVKNTNGWIVRPVVELGYVWAFGDTDTNQTVSLNGASNGFGYDVTDSGSYVGRFVLEAEKANISYALGYEYQKGDDVEADKWMVNVNWKF